MKETVVEVKDVSIKFNMSSEKYDSFKEILYLIFDYPHKHYTFKYFEV